MMSALEKFIKYFETKVEEICSEKSDSNTIILPNYHYKILTEDQQLDPILFEAELCVSPEYEKTSLCHNILLTSREKECLSLIAQGYTMKNAARKLKISPRTVEQHLRNIKDKYGLNTKNQLVEIWHEIIN